MGDIDRPPIKHQQTSPPDRADEPAFPTAIVCGEMGIAQGGITVRDYFAAKAMAAVILDNWREASDEPYRTLAPSIAADAYCIADAMIAARHKRVRR